MGLLLFFLNVAPLPGQVTKIDQIDRRGKHVIQQYIRDPLLINSRKVDMRIYVVVTSFDPLRVYCYEDG